MSAEPHRPRPRLHALVPTELDDEQRNLYDAITSGPRGSGAQRFRLVDDDGALAGPFNAFLLRPVLGDRLQALGAAIRYSTSLSDRDREISILIVAAQWQSEFEQHAHEAIGRGVGLTELEMAAIRQGTAGDTEANWPDPDDRTLVRVVRALAAEGDLDDAMYEAAVRRVGEAGVFELLTLVGYYSTAALQLRVFGVGAPSGVAARSDEGATP